MSDESEQYNLKRSERFLLALAYLEATMEDDLQKADLIMKSTPPAEFLMGLTVLNQSLYMMYEVSGGDGATLIRHLREFGQSMQTKEV